MLLRAPPISFTRESQEDTRHESRPPRPLDAADPRSPLPGLTTYDAKDPDTQYPPIEPLRPPAGAPNVLDTLIDDAGYGASSVFGGPCATPHAEKLAAGGLSFNRIHTTALCTPTRQSLLTGRNHHSVGMGSITETATSAPGNSSVRPNTKAPLAMTLKLNDYSTAQLGKCHEVPVWQSSPMGPFDAWPSGGGGFETFYGFIGGENNQWDPALYNGTTPVEPPATPEEGYHLTEDLADHACDWIRAQKSLMPDKPFFVYFAPGATHAPHHVPKEWADKYAGTSADGWDVQRERTFAKQKELGVVPGDALLTPRHAEIPAWDDMPAALKPALEREMEVYAGFMEHTDHHVGRVAAKTAEFGSPSSYNHYAVGWAWAMDTPFQWTKQVAPHWGGTRNGTIVHWPTGIAEKGGLRQQFTHCIDIAPTILEAAGLPEPTMVNGVQQTPMEGVSMLYTFDDQAAAERHDLQYFEMFGNRGLYYKGWSAVTKHRTPWVLVGGEIPAFDDDVWELYDGRTDFSQARNLVAENPQMLAKLQRLWLIEATKYNVLPIDDRGVERATPEVAGRPTLIRGEQPAPLRRDGSAVGEQRRQHQEQVVLGDGRTGHPRGRRQRRDHRAGGPVRRLEPLRLGRPGSVRVQRARHPGVQDRGGGSAAGRDVPGADGIRLRRRWAGQGRRRDLVLRRKAGGHRPGRRHPGHDFLGRRDHRRRLRNRHRRRLGLHHEGQQVHRPDQLDADRPG
ncbi:MAG: arylsulfatase [Cryobacterium sp.]|jgi:arylsulfatase A-like enzyme|nr:arylsulfatase [Cryobacterium sp.]